MMFRIMTQVEFNGDLRAVKRSLELWKQIYYANNVQMHHKNKQI